MKIELFDFQKDALHRLRESLQHLLPDASSYSPRAITFSAPTGSGKTVIMTALFEAILDGPDDQLDWPIEWEPQKDAVILWVSDIPELNEQTRRKIERQSSRINWITQLVTVDATFDQERLQGGCIYFINTQKLATDKLLTREGDNRTYSLWRTLTNTARAIPDRFYVIIDEAHRGMSNGRKGSAAQSIVQRFIKGHAETGLVKMPLVVGISATPRRFNELLGDTEHTISRVTVLPEAVRASGLLKERILIHHPDVTAKVELGLLEEAARRWMRMGTLWTEYCEGEGEGPVRPILVVQVEDASGNAVTKTDLGAAVSAIQGAVGRPLLDAELAHSFVDRNELQVGERVFRYIEPSRIEETSEVSIVFFKMSLSTGWDCPRAEVMMSFRRAEDHTYIAQLLGRMVRTPLAHRIEGKSELNDVHLFLPRFDGKAVKDVIRALQTSDDVPPAEAADARELVTLKRRQGTEPIFNAMRELVTYRVNAYRAQSNIRRYQELARKLSIDGIDEDAWDKAKYDAINWITQQVLVLKNSGQFERDCKSLTDIGLNTVAVQSVTGASEDHTDYLIEASDLDIDRQFQESGRSLGNGLHQEYRKRNEDRDALEVKLELIVAARAAATKAVLEQKSKDAFNTLFDRYRADMRPLREQQRRFYERLRSASTTPEPLDWRLQETIDFRRDPNSLSWDRHLYIEDDGSFRTSLGGWEADVLGEELKRREVVGWLRNLDRKPWSLEIPYRSAGAIKPMFPDMLIVRHDADQFFFDILEPHDPSRADNIDKAQGLAEFSEKHGALFKRIQLIRKQGGGFARLDLNRSTVRQKVRLLTSNAQLDDLFKSAAEVM
jgi:type III restriction enzyme